MKRGDSISPRVAAEPRGHWNSIAARWQHVASPLRPSPDDLEFAAELARDSRRPLILGVTPEYFHLPWPREAQLLAVDRSPAMIRALWPGKPGSALTADWLNAPLAPASRDLVLCDGGFHLLSHPAGQSALASRLAEILEPGGRLLLRLFIPPDEPESPDAVLRDLLEGKLQNVNTLKLRLAMSLQRSPATGTRLGDVWNILHDRCGDLANLSQRLEIPADQLLAVETYRDSNDRYSFVTLNEARHLLSASGLFRPLAVEYGSYPFAHQCPTLILERTKA